MILFGAVLSDTVMFSFFSCFGPETLYPEMPLRLRSERVLRCQSSHHNRAVCVAFLLFELLCHILTTDWHCCGGEVSVFRALKSICDVIH